MRFKSILPAVALFMVLFWGCKENRPEWGSPMSVTMLGVGGYPNMDTELEFGLFVGEPVGLDNVKFTVSTTGRIVSKNNIKWKFDQTQSARFFAYSPYDESYSGQESVTVTIPTDQSSMDKILKANLLTAYASGGPKDRGVTLQAKHAMTSMVISFDNRTGQRITGVKAGRFMNVGTLDLVTGQLQPTTQTDVINAMRCPGNDDAFCFMYIPQEVTPYFEVTLESGKKIGFDIISDESSRLQEFPGMVVKLKDIQITESTQEVNILKELNASVLPWTTNGIPSMPSGLRYISLKEMMEISADERNYEFLANLNKVTVTAVDYSDDGTFGLVLEDSTRAVHVWTYDDCELDVGNTVVGPVTGMMSRASDGKQYIKYFNTSLATIDKTKNLPCTEGTFESVSADIGRFEYRRMLFRDVTIKERFDGDRAVFEQDGKEMSVVSCLFDDISVVPGAHGDLIGFPVRSGLDNCIMLYDGDCLDGFTKEYDECSLMRCPDYGWYEIEDPDTAVYVLNGPDSDFQYSLWYRYSDRYMQVMDVRRFESHLIILCDCEGKPVEGHEYIVKVSSQGKLEEYTWTGVMECIKVVDDTAWFITDMGYGLVMLL